MWPWSKIDELESRVIYLESKIKSYTSCIEQTRDLDLYIKVLEYYLGFGVSAAKEHYEALLEIREEDLK